MENKAKSLKNNQKYDELKNIIIKKTKIKG